MLLVLCAPSKQDSYYRKYFSRIIDFLINYAKTVHGRDDVIVLADKDTMPSLCNHLPSEILLTIEEKLDPWLRDVSPVIPNRSIQFKFTGGLKSKEAKFLQHQFNRFIDKYNIERSKVNLINDGGNVVHNNKDCVFVTDKFLQLNRLKENEGIGLLKDALKVDHVVILPADDEKLGHVDGMCSFLSENTLFLVKYDDDETFRAQVKKKLTKYLPSQIEVVEIDCGKSSHIAEGGFSSAYGLYVNCVPTEKFIYIPMFGDELDIHAKETFQQYAGGKECVFIDVHNVCDLGGSLRCLSWQVVGENAQKLIKAAKAGPPF